MQHAAILKKQGSKVMYVLVTYGQRFIEEGRDRP